MKKHCILIAGFFFFCISMFAQKQDIANYTGTWRWVSGNKDTFEIILMADHREEITSNKLIGYHRYVEKGQLVESDFREIGEMDKKITIFSITGAVQENKVLIYWFKDYTRDRTFSGELQMLSDFPNKAIWNLPNLNEKWIYYGIGIREYPLGRTVPNNILLEKIK